MPMNPTTLKQSTIAVPVGGGEITVRRMYHKPMREFLKKLGREVATRAEFFKPGADGRIWPDLDQILAKLPELLESADGLADFVLSNSVDAEAEKIDRLDFNEWAALLAAALKLNCGDELKNSFAGIGDALAPMLANLTKTSNGA